MTNFENKSLLSLISVSLIGMLSTWPSYQSSTEQLGVFAMCMISCSWITAFRFKLVLDQEQRSKARVQ
ncbi:hypothetical protein [Xanthomonas cannabis]|uniref:hypothetical protein n=1 Tax=Xanthomonas cannabis TaxID=1885674 RepID=UPI000573755C|nr:hypothetical protein [Xanthomonas cannabis]KHL55302.1 hypothetical protein OZ13_11665 [Xanthomonas cannabis pv. cannabis]